MPEAPMARAVCALEHGHGVPRAGKLLSGGLTGCIAIGVRNDHNRLRVPETVQLPREARLVDELEVADRMGGGDRFSLVRHSKMAKRKRCGDRGRGNGGGEIGFRHCVLLVRLGPENRHCSAIIPLGLWRPQRAY